MRNKSLLRLRYRRTDTTVIRSRGVTALESEKQKIFKFTGLKEFSKYAEKFDKKNGPAKNYKCM